MSGPTLLERLLARRGIRLLFWLVIAHVHFSGATVAPQQVTPYGDDHMHYLFDEAARRSILEYGQVPHWNPYYCGGIGGITNSEATWLAPDFGTRLLFGTGPGRRLAFLLFVILGLEGLFLLARHHEASVLASLLAAVIFAGSGTFTHHLDRGWLNLLTFELMPWVWLGFARGLREWRWRLVGGVALAWMALGGGTYSFPFSVLLVGVLTLGHGLAWMRRPPEGVARPWLSPLLTAATLGAVGVCLAAAKLVPVLAALGQVQVVTKVYGHLLLEVLHHLIATAPERGEIPATFAYVGLLPLLLAPLALFTGRRGVGLLLGALFFLVLSTGDFGALSPYVLLGHLPVFEKLRFPIRYLVVFTLFLAVALAVGLTWLEGLPRRLAERRTHRGLGLTRAPTLGKLLAGGLGAIAAVSVLHTTGIWSGRIHTHPPPATADLDFVQMRGNRWDAHIWAPMNVGSLTCITGMQVTQSPALRPDLPREEYALPPGSAEVERERWSPSRLELAVSARAATTVVVNQNHAPGWRAEPGELFSHQGLLAVRLPAGEHRLTLEYTSPGWRWGLGLSLTTLALLLGVALRDGARRLRGWLRRYRSL